jgi:hypothetical protein
MGGYRRTPEVDRWLLRLRRVRDGWEPVPGAASWLLTELRAHYGGKDDVVRRALNVSDRLLERINALAGGSHATQGRKTKKGQIPLSDDHLAWLTRAMVKLVSRAAQVAAAGTSSGLALITVADV